MEAISKLQAYAARNNLTIVDINVDFKKVKILFKERPTAEQIADMKRELYFIDSTVDIKLKPSAFSMHEMVLTVSWRTHNIFVGVHRELVQIPGLRIEQVEVREGEIVFYYHMTTRAFLNASELDSIQTLVDPTIADHDSIRVFGFKGQYTLYIRFND